ncbi:MAG: DNA helicase RecG [Candidatus Omnitrophica bacterium CG07_land_8_20_14_0_80_42_15]|uniref:ATP-dependent DNA helicase RecG n=1 Tax=Candidatus Aquitaenariimonas noxiae TaxID=1974741 RepID=A0A2J0KVY2_9BACT|nr:MAG: DNA helicase RecG [Candidatus Omnitrophica bacterium CG07_land_8_20_14_0_80_42_15]
MQAKNSNLQTSVRYIKGVGPKRADTLKRLGLTTIEDILFYLPRRYEDRSNLKTIKEVEIGKAQTIKGEVLTFSVRRTKKGMNIFQLAVGDHTGVIYGIWFNQPFMRKFFRVGERVILHGKVERYDVLQINQPEYEILKPEETVNIHMGRITPIYPLTQNISQRYLRSLAYYAVKNYSHSIGEMLPTRLRAKHKLVDMQFAVNNAHFPKDFGAIERSYRRLVFDEFFILQIAIALKCRNIKEGLAGISHKIDENLLESFRKNLPFELTPSQLKAIKEIENDMKSAKPMNRLLEGDVGSGKTVVACYAILLTIKNKFQACIMAPTEILAQQHYMTLSKILAPYGVNVELLVSSLPENRKEEIRKSVKSGETDLIIGTHALIQEDVDFSRLGLAVIDEQHKFGVTQRSILREKGKSADILVMTATPIPRTLALTVYGDLDISVIKELPPGRRPVNTYWVEESGRGKVYNFIKEEINKGRQAYIVCPRIKETEKSQTQAASMMYEKLKDEVFKEFSVGLIHGKMGAQEKDVVMKKFKEGKLKILVSTVIIEVGIDVSNASIMLVENAERFGLAQLHQLRGRVGRGEYDSYCILMANPRTELAQKRLKAIAESTDGFEIAEEDLELRGSGEIFGTRQHGLPEMRFGSILHDRGIMELARKEAFDIIKEDPNLNDPRNYPIHQRLKERFGNKIELIKVG